jgi:hypothetical protein
MRKIAIALAAFAALGIALPMTSPASADTVKKVVIKRDNDRDRHVNRDRAKKVVVIKRDRDRDRRAFARDHNKKVVIIKKRGSRDRDD